MDLRQIAGLTATPSIPRAVLAPYVHDKALQDRIELLRSQGEIVIVDLPGHEENRAELNCDRVLVIRNGSWMIEKV